MLKKTNICVGTTLKGVVCKKKVLNAGEYCHFHRINDSGLSSPANNVLRLSLLCAGLTKLGLPCKNPPKRGSVCCRHHHVVNDGVNKEGEINREENEFTVITEGVDTNEVSLPELDYVSYMSNNKEFNLHHYLMYIEEPLRAGIKNSKEYFDILPEFKGNCIKLELESVIFRSRSLRLYLSDHFIKKHLSNGSIPVSRALYYQAEQLDASTVGDCLIRFKSNIGYISRIHSEVLANSGELTHEFVSKCISVDILSGWRSDMAIPNAVVAMCVIFLEIARSKFSF